jgi:hypothetical protein
MPDDRFAPPGPKSGSHLRIMAQRGPAGELVTDALIDSKPAPKRRKFKTIDEIHAFVTGPMEGAAWQCGCIAACDARGNVRAYEPCARHLAQLS